MCGFKRLKALLSFNKKKEKETNVGIIFFSCLLPTFLFLFLLMKGIRPGLFLSSFISSGTSLYRPASSA
jgi:hypothetical protein